MSSQFFRQYIDLLAEQETPEWQKRARDIAMQMGVIAPQLANIEYKDNIPVKINGDPVPDRLYSDAERAKLKGQSAPAATAGKPSGTQVQTDDEGNHTITTPDGKTIVVGPDGKPLPNGGRLTPGSQAASPAGGDDRITALQKELKAKGADLGGFGPAGDGIDGKLGPKTRTAAGKFPEIAAKYKDVLGDTSSDNQAASPAGQPAGPKDSTTSAPGKANPANIEKLNSALAGIEQILQKYKVDVKEDIDYVLENINKFTQQEQLEIWRLITEDDKPKLPPGAKFDRATGNWYVTEPGGGKRILGGTATTTPAPTLSTKEPGKFAKFMSKLGGASGISKKAATRVGASAIGGPLAPWIAAGSIIWTAWDIGKALYDTFADDEQLAKLDDKDQAIVKQHMATIVALQKDKEFMDQLDPATKKRLENALKGLNALAVDTGYKPDNQTVSTAADQKTADRGQDMSSAALNTSPTDQKTTTQVKDTPKTASSTTTTANSNLSQFSMKGLKFGMSASDVRTITKSQAGAEEYDTDKYGTGDIMYGYKSLDGFSIGGETGWYPTYNNKKLGAVGLSINPNDFDEWFEKLTANYGKPSNMSIPEVGNLMGYKTKNIEVWWNYQDVYISLKRFNSKLTEGSVWIAWNNYISTRAAQKAAQKSKNQKDFE